MFTLNDLREKGPVSVLTVLGKNIHKQDDCLEAAAFCEAESKNKTKYPYNSKEWEHYANLYFSQALRLSHSRQHSW